jgi:hypothetical protein
VKPLTHSGLRIQSNVYLFSRLQNWVDCLLLQEYHQEFSCVPQEVGDGDYSTSIILYYGKTSDSFVHHLLAASLIGASGSILWGVLIISETFGALGFPTAYSSYKIPFSHDPYRCIVFHDHQVSYVILRH